MEKKNTTAELKSFELKPELHDTSSDNLLTRSPLLLSSLAQSNKSSGVGNGFVHLCDDMVKIDRIF